ncbi:zinc finger CCCH domain-containing protein 67 [Artemisia annua]|uniref:Zinc finger CCCH domain-containing protein 67 n=1 Tax=Artemisia annua TaxID=35608 RepID=A0A2U1Q8L3_ARTAN|nr:zinc finger CCCH domain-containing protein 67 [Artemisia annua]
MQSNLNTNKSHASKPNCVMFLGYGICSYYPRCKFNHPGASKMEIVDEKAQKNGRRSTPCKFYLAGTCKYRSFCKYDHSGPTDPQPLVNSTGLPLRPNEQPCFFYLRNRDCKFGSGCKFNHPELHDAGSSGVTDDGASGSEIHVQSGNQGNGVSGNHEKNVTFKFGRVNFDGITPETQE